MRRWSPPWCTCRRCRRALHPPVRKSPATPRLPFNPADFGCGDHGQRGLALLCPRTGGAGLRPPAFAGPWPAMVSGLKSGPQRDARSSRAAGRPLSRGAFPPATAHKPIVIWWSRSMRSRDTSLTSQPGLVRDGRRGITGQHAQPVGSTTCPQRASSRSSARKEAARRSSVRPGRPTAAPRSHGPGQTFRPREPTKSCEDGQDGGAATEQLQREGQSSRSEQLNETESRSAETGHDCPPRRLTCPLCDVSMIT